jgi:dynein heavy chain
MAQAEKTARKAALADRLINGLSGENKRWSETIARLEVTEVKLVGDVLLAAAFVSYAGPFNMQFRQQLVNERWMPDLIERAIPMTQGGRPGLGRGCRRCWDPPGWEGQRRWEWALHWLAQRTGQPAC